MAQRTLKTVGDLLDLIESRGVEREARLLLKDGESEARHTVIFDSYGDAGFVLNHTQ